MKTFTSGEYSALSERLTEIMTSAENDLQRFEQSYTAVKDVMERLKDFVIAYEFKDIDEEIHFFRDIKPMFLRELIYYREVLHIEACKPLKKKDLLLSYYNGILDRINDYFERNHVFYLYHKMGRTNQDELFYSRNTENDLLLPEYVLDMDPKFSTIHSFKLSKIQAYEMLNEFLLSSIHRVEHPLTELTDQRKSASLWTDSKSSLIELAYALHARGSVNHGKGDVKQIITDLEFLFNVELGNFYRTFQSMRIRKKNRTSYIDNLKESLERHMDNTDLKYS